jgi:hypothetical protein
LSRRTPTVVVLDALLGLATKLQAVPMPQPRVRAAGDTRGPVWRVLLLIGLVAALGGTAMLVTALVRSPATSVLRPETAAGLPGPPSPSAPPAAIDAVESPAASRTTPAGPLPTTTAPSQSQSPSPSGAPAPRVPGARPPSREAATVAPPLTASYTTSSYAVGLLGYHVEAVVANPGDRARDGWRLVVTLPRSTLTVSKVSGATATKDGAVWTFTPDASTSRVPRRGSVSVGFDVHGATLINAAPTGCRIDGNACDTR